MIEHVKLSYTPICNPFENEKQNKQTRKKKQKHSVPKGQMNVIKKKPHEQNKQKKNHNNANWIHFFLQVFKKKKKWNEMMINVKMWASFKIKQQITRTTNDSHSHSKIEFFFLAHTPHKSNLCQFFFALPIDRFSFYQQTKTKF